MYVSFLLLINFKRSEVYSTRFRSFILWKFTHNTNSTSLCYMTLGRRVLLWSLPYHNLLVFNQLFHFPTIVAIRRFCLTNRTFRRYLLHHRHHQPEDNVSLSTQLMLYPNTQSNGCRQSKGCKVRLTVFSLNPRYAMMDGICVKGPRTVLYRFRRHSLPLETGIPARRNCTLYTTWFIRIHAMRYAIILLILNNASRIPTKHIASALLFHNVPIRHTECDIPFLSFANWNGFVRELWTLFSSSPPEGLVNGLWCLQTIVPHAALG